MSFACLQGSCFCSEAGRSITSPSFDDLFPSSAFLFRPERQFFKPLTFSWKEKLPILTHLYSIISPRSFHSSPVNRGRYVASTAIQWDLQEFCIQLILREAILIMVTLPSISEEECLRQSTKESVLPELCNHASRQGNGNRVKKQNQHRYSWNSDFL